MKMLGRKVRIPPTPAITPSTTREVSMGLVCIAARPPETAPEKKSRAVSKYPFSQSPTVKVKKKTRAMMRRKMGSPSQRLVRYRSIFSVEASFWLLFTRISLITSSIKSYF